MITSVPDTDQWEMQGEEIYTTTASVAAEIGCSTTVGAMAGHTNSVTKTVTARIHLDPSGSI